MYQDQEITGTYTAQCLYMHAYDLLVLINVLTVNRNVIKISTCWVYAFCRIILSVRPTIIWSQVCLSRVWVTLTGQQDSWCMDNSTGNRLVRWSDMLLNCVTVFSVSSSFTPWVEVSIFFFAKMWKCSVTCYSIDVHLF